LLVCVLCGAAYPALVPMHGQGEVMGRQERIDGAVKQ
jgi:hypothetical protein